MDRISALRNVEDALARYEKGELSLPELERAVRGTLRSYATDFDEGRLYRAQGDETGVADGLVVVAGSRVEARERVAELLTEPETFDIEAIDR
ncbi:MAG: hypothetical protein J07HX64_00755 [halophilic archaeon J07HX64]|jgi:hypothetical protein|nr:MAG: hypothetical protein J07HX64_00755 [halophilic archaeon J07HX64]